MDEWVGLDNPNNRFVGWPGDVWSLRTTHFLWWIPNPRKLPIAEGNSASSSSQRLEC